MNISLNFYNEALRYASSLIRSKYKDNSLYNAYDIVHEAILKENLVNDNYRKLVFTQYKQLTCTHKHVPFSEISNIAIQEPTLCCKRCGESMLQNYFVKVTNYALGKINYISLCKTCEKKRKSKYNIGKNYVPLTPNTKFAFRHLKDSTLLTDRYIKQLLTRRHKNLVVTAEMITTHREQLIKKRASKKTLNTYEQNTLQKSI